MRCLQSHITKTCLAVFRDVKMLLVNKAWVPAITVCDSKLYKQTTCVPIPSIIVSPSSISPATTGLVYQQQLTATGGYGLLVFSASGLPSGVSISADGMISGRPTMSGATTLQVTVQDAIGNVTVASYPFVTTDSSPVEVASLHLNTGEDNIDSSVLDPDAGYGYFGTIRSTPTQIVKVRLSDLTRVGTLELDADRDLTSASIDTANGVVYFVTAEEPSRILKISLSDFTVIDTLLMNTGDNYLTGGPSAIDLNGGFLYLGTQPDVVGVYLVKVDLRTFTRVGIITLNPTGGAINFTCVDPVGSFVYCGDYTSPGMIYKVRLSDFTLVGTLTLPPGDDVVHAGFIYEGFLYCGCFGKLIIKVRLSDFTLAGTLTPPSSGTYIHGASYDPVAGFGYFGLRYSGEVVKVRLSDFTVVGVAAVAGASGGIGNAVATDPTTGLTYVGTIDAPAILAKFS